MKHGACWVSAAASDPLLSHGHRAATCARAAFVCGNHTVLDIARDSLNGGRERSAGLLPPAHRNIQHADTAVAVRLEGAHPQGYGKSERLLITGVDCCPCRGF